MTNSVVVIDSGDVCRGGPGREYHVEFETWGEGTPRIVMLHDGLGSVAQWRNTPAAIARRCGVAVLAYNRPGHGNSTPVPTGPWPTLWLHHQAELLGLLLEAWGIDNPLLVGHSDGGSIALLYAAGEGAGPERLDRRCRAVVSLAAHTFVEPICGQAISRLLANPSRMHAALNPFHRHPDAVFAAWSGVWLSEPFSHWDIRERLSAVEIPTWLVQGERDEYGTEAQLWTTARAIGGHCRTILLPDLGHLVHHQDSDVVVDIVARAMAATG
jgi:pimeloyl-ACP methyl ester carboxylesterase